MSRPSKRILESSDEDEDEVQAKRHAPDTSGWF